MAWDPTYMDGLDLTLATAEDADFVLLQGSQCIRDGSEQIPADAGVFTSGQPSTALDAALRTCAARDLLMICANPDLTVVLPDGSTAHMPGAIARAYETLGGRVIYFGKPYLPAFHEALELLGPSVDPSRVLHIGDSLLHDIAGANAAGIDSLFVAGGIHAQELGVAETGAMSDVDESRELQRLSEEALENAFETHSIRPTMSTSAFRW